MFAYLTNQDKRFGFISLYFVGVISNWMDEIRIPPCTIYQAFKYFLDIATPPSPLLLQQFAPLATNEKQRKRLEVLSKVRNATVTQDFYLHHQPRRSALLRHTHLCLFRLQSAVIFSVWLRITSRNQPPSFPRSFIPLLCLFFSLTQTSRCQRHELSSRRGNISLSSPPTETLTTIFRNVAKSVCLVSESFFLVNMIWGRQMRRWTERWVADDNKVFLNDDEYVL